PTRQIPRARPSTLKLRVATGALLGLPFADRAVDEEGARRDEEERPEAGELVEVEPTEVVGEEDDAHHHERDSPRGRLRDLLLLDGNTAEETLVDRGRALPGVDHAEERDEGNEEREGEGVAVRDEADD